MVALDQVPVDLPMTSLKTSWLMAPGCVKNAETFFAPLYHQNSTGESPKWDERTSYPEQMTR